jgi:hypothetical protein
LLRIDLKFYIQLTDLLDIQHSFALAARLEDRNINEILIIRRWDKDFEDVEDKLKR